MVYNSVDYTPTLHSIKSRSDMTCIVGTICIAISFITFLGSSLHLGFDGVNTLSASVIGCFIFGSAVFGVGCMILGYAARAQCYFQNKHQTTKDEQIASFSLQFQVSSFPSLNDRENQQQPPTNAVNISSLDDLFAFVSKDVNQMKVRPHDLNSIGNLMRSLNKLEPVNPINTLLIDLSYLCNYSTWADYYLKECYLTQNKWTGSQGSWKKEDVKAARCAIYGAVALVTEKKVESVILDFKNRSVQLEEDWPGFRYNTHNRAVVHNDDNDYTYVR